MVFAEGEVVRSAGKRRSKWLPSAVWKWADVVNTEVGRKPQQEVTREYIH